ncbi:MAG: ComEC/Rec2 family competence protein, partial [Minisyncoccia bacterium]
WYRALLIFLYTCSLGLLRVDYAYTALPSPIFDGYLGTKQIIVAEVVSSIDARDTTLSFVVKPLTEDGSLETVKHTPRIQVSTDRLTDVSYGDIVRIEGTLKSIVSHSKTYERIGEARIRKGILYEVKFAEVVFIERGQGNFFKYYSTVIHDWIQNTIITYVREPSAGFINGILIGEKHALSKEWYDAFTAVGLTHVIVLSGYNLTVIFAWTRILLRRTSFLIQNSLGALSVIILVLVSGAEAPAVRAGILVLIVALAAVLQRQQDSGYFLSLAILCMLFVNPFYFLYDVSFQLSVAATYGLVYIGPIIQTQLKRVPRMLGEVVRDTSSAQLAVLPLQLFYFGTLSWVALFVNVLVLPFIPLLMILGVLILATSVMPVIALFVGTCAGLISSILLSSVKVVSTMVTPMAVSISLWGLVLFYIILVFWIIQYKKT